MPEECGGEKKKKFTLAEERQPCQATSFYGTGRGDQPSLFPLCRGLSGRSLVALVLPQHGACTAGWRGCICWVNAVKIPKSPAREREEQTDSTLFIVHIHHPNGGQGTAQWWEVPQVTPFMCHPSPRWIPSPSQVTWKHETWAKNEDTSFSSKGARWCPKYLVISFFKGNSCCFSPMTLFATASFTYADPWLNFKELYYWSQQ